MPCPECSATRSNPKDPSFSVHITREGGWAKCFHCDFAIAWNEDEMWKREQKQQDRERQKQQKDAPQHRNTSQHHDAASQHHNRSQRKPHIPLQPPVHYVCPVINKNKQIMNGEMMEYMVDRRGIPMDVLTRMKIEERLEFLPQTGKEEACICFPYLEDGVMKNMKFRDAAKHFKMVKGAEHSLEHRRHKREGKVLHHRRRDRCPQPDSRRTGRGGVRTQRSRRREPSVAGPLRGVALR